MTEWGRTMFVTPGVVVDGKLVTTDLVDINLGIRILLGISFYDDWDGPGDVRHARPARQPGRPAAPVEPAHQPAAAEARLRRQVHLGHVAALVRRQGPPRARHRRRPARPAVVDGAGRPGRHRLRQGDRPQREDQPAEDGAQGPGRASSGRSRSGATPSSATGPAPTSRPTPPPAALHFAEQALAEIRAGRTKTWETFEVPDEAHRLRLHRGGARRAVAPHRHPRRQDRQLPPVPADAVERQPARHLRHARPVRGRGAGPADLRGERPRQLQGHRHHAHGAQLRPVPAVRRAHVPRRRARRWSCCTRRPSPSPASDADAAAGRTAPPPTPGGGRASGSRRCSTPAPPAAPVARERAEELVRLVADLYGAGLERLLD